VEDSVVKNAYTYHGNCDKAVFIARGAPLQANGKAKCTDDECKYNETDGNTLNERDSGVMLQFSADGKIRPECCVLSWSHIEWFEALGGDCRRTKVQVGKSRVI
jgi:hypothetical protein